MRDADDGAAARAQARAMARAVRRVNILLGMVPLPDLTADELAAVFANRIGLAEWLAPPDPHQPAG